MRAAGNEPGKVRHVDQIKGAHLVGNLAHAGKVNRPRISASPADNQLGAFPLRKLFQLVIVDGFRLFGDAVGDDLVRLAGKIQMMPVRQMSAMRQIQPQNRIARLQNRSVRFHVRLRSGVGLHIGVLRAKQFLRPVPRQVLDNIRKLAAAVITLAGISFGILIREHRAGSLQHGFADKIFRGDQFQAFVLAAGLVINGGGYQRIALGERAVHRIGGVFHVVFLISYTSGRCSSM